MRNFIDYRKVKKYRGFDSKKEQARSLELELLQKAGVITDLQAQYKVELQPRFKRDGKTYRPIIYVADFYYKENGRETLEEVKGFETEVWKIKKKMVLYQTSFILKVTK